MNVRKRGLALLMCICMIFTLLPFSALADATAQDDGIVYGKYSGTTWTPQEGLTAENVPYTNNTTGANVEYSKTASKNDDGSYNVTLTIKSKTSETAPGASAVVLVIDISTSMEYCAECGSDRHIRGCKYYASGWGADNSVKPGQTRLAAAKEAAVSFVKDYAGNNKNSGRNLKIVSFQGYGYINTASWLDVSNSDAKQTAISTINSLKPIYYPGNGTNLEQGLSKAKDCISSAPNGIANNNKFAVVLTDGAPNRYGSNSSGEWASDRTIYNKTIATAKMLKAACSVYTVCFGASNDTFNGSTVGNFLKNDIASNTSYAFDADNSEDLNNAFKNIFKSIEQGISSGFTVTDPMGQYVNLDSASLTGNGASVNNGTITWEPKNGDTVDNSDSSKTTTYTLTYKVTLGEVPKDGTYPLNENTTLKFKDGDTEKTLHFNVPGVKGTAPRYTVTYQPGDHGTLTGADNNGNVVHPNLKNGDPTPDAPKVNPQYGYYHIGWDPVIVDTVNGSATYTARYEKLNNLSYTIKHYWIGDKTQTIREDIVKSDATLGDTITVEVDNAAHIDGYTIMPEQSENSTTITEDSNKVINLYYYKNVTVEARNYEKAAGTADPTFEATVTGVVGTDNINYTITRPDGETAGSYTLTPSGNNIQGNYYVVEWKPGTLTIYDTYTVTYKYEYTDGTPVPETVLAAPVDSNSPYRAGSPVTVLNAPTDTIDGYIFDGWYIGTTKMDGMSFEIMSDTVIIGKWKPVTGLTCTINYIWNGNKTTPIRTVTIDGLTYNEVVKKFPMDIPGYTPVSNDSKEIVIKTTGNVINFYYYKNVTLESNSGTFTYDGKDHSVSGYDVITKADNGEDVKVDAEFSGVSASRTEKDIGSYPVTFKIKGDVVDKEALIGETDSNSYYIVSDVEEGTLTIEKIKDEVTVKITGNTKTVTYNGKEQSVEGYVADTNGLPITVSLATGKVAEAKGTDVGTYYMQLTAADFVVTSDIYANIKVIVEDGWLKINRRPMPPVNPPIMDEIIVEITGNSDSVVYDGAEHSVKGYTVKISDPRYTEADFTFTGKAEASGVNAGTYEMGLKAEQFKNTNARFTNVKFVIKADGVLTITPKDLTITAGSKTEYGPTPVTCDEWTVSGLAAGDKVESVKITGIQSVPGSSPNVPSDAVIKNAKGEDVTKNYAIKYVNGTLTMLEVLNKEDHFNYIIGTPEGLSLPTANVTRAEVATIFFRLMTDDARAKFDSLDNNFSDVAKGKWYNRAISTLAKAGIIKGDPAGTYRPGDPITRAEMAAIIARFGDFKEGGKTFNDISGHWAQKYIELAASNGWINGNPDGTFKPNNNITRAETVAMINRVLNRQTESNDDLLPVSQMTNWSDNMDTAKWYYRDMQEATNNHKAERVGNSIYEKWTEKLPDIDWASYQI